MLGNIHICCTLQRTIPVFCEGHLATIVTHRTPYTYFLFWPGCNRKQDRPGTVGHGEGTGDREVPGQLLRWLSDRRCLESTLLPLGIADGQNRVNSP